MKRTVFGLFAVLSLVFGVGCSGTDNGGGGGTQNDDVPAGMWLVGSCYEETSDGGAVCQEIWTSQAQTIQSEFRDETGENCRMDGGDWDRAEATCPTGAAYVGTCILEIAGSYKRDHYYSQRLAAAQSGCETIDGEWVVE
jgi:hypothetical protein